MSTIFKFVILTFILYLMSTNQLFAQQDSVKYDLDFKFNDGFFLDFNQVRSNQAIPFKNIITNNNTDLFLEKLTNIPSFMLFVNGEKKNIETKNIWGYAKNDVIYIQYNKKFYRVPSIGSISFFVANIEVQYQTGMNPWNNSFYGTQGQSYTTDELHQFLIDFKTGTLYEYSIKSIEKLISFDKELFTEYTKLKKRKQKQLSFIYIRRFNESHPLYFPNN